MLKRYSYSIAAWAGCLLIASTPQLRAQGGVNSYGRHNLVSDVAGLADRTDPKLVNAWGIDHSPTGPWWVNANGTGVSIVYDGTGAPVPPNSPLVVTIPPPSGTGTSTPTGIAYNGTSDFQIAPGWPAIFLFATEDGTISGWNPNVNPTQAVIKVNNSGIAVYKGLTLGQISGKNVIYVANFKGGTVDVYDANFNPMSLSANAFRDPLVPAGFAPFNVQIISNSIMVTFAKQDADKEDDVPGPGFGFVDQFTEDGTLINRLEHGTWMNSPWAVALAPANFGALSGTLLVGNFGSGWIAAFDPTSGKFVGFMLRPGGKPITIDGLWGLKFGNGLMAGPTNVLYFSAGIQDEAHGLFGFLKPSQ